MSLHIFKESFVDRLQASVLQNERKYREDKVWVPELAGGSSWCIDTQIEFKDELDLLKPEGEDRKDLENAIRLHKALGFLTPLQARDPRLWGYLAHVELWPYMRSRWNVERKCGNDVAKAERYIISHYFVAQNQSRALLRHGIARLWWYARITHDSERTNPYELTAVLLDQLDITQQIMERNLGRAKQVTTGFLEFLLRHKSELLGSGDKKRAIIRHLAKHLNLYGGISLLDCLDSTEIISLLEEEYARVLAKPEFVDAS